MKKSAIIAIAIVFAVSLVLVQAYASVWPSQQRAGMMSNNRESCRMNNSGMMRSSIMGGGMMNGGSMNQLRQSHSMMGEQCQSMM